jgi:SGNH hydrolase-like domain, acetyltransferase AlgX
VALVAVSLAVGLLLLEGVLRRWPTLLGYTFASGALSKYTADAGGIYYSDRNLRIHFMIPNYRTTMFANGYTWHHETDSLGFRNPQPRVPADVVILGDSLVYGHGVEVEDTVARALERRTKLRVANLGRQGDCAFQEAYILTEYIGVFRPRYVVHVFSPNDIRDLYGFLSRRAMEEFIERPVSEITYPPRLPIAVALAQRDAKLRRRSIWKRIEQESYVAKMLRWVHHEYRERFGTAAVAVAQAAWRGTPPDVVDVDHDPGSVGWRYTAHALAYLKYVSARTGARLIMAPATGDEGHWKILEDIAQRHQIDLVDTRPLLSPSNAAPSFLPRDGHFSPEGARLLAELIARHLECLVTPGCPKPRPAP